MKKFSIAGIAGLVIASAAFMVGCAPVATSDNAQADAVQPAALEAAAPVAVYKPGEYAKAPLTKEQLRAKLTDVEYYVTQQSGTERPFGRGTWNNKADGIYVDVVSGEPLFSSKDKYKSGTGWPSFSRPLVSSNIVEKADNTLFASRVEVRSKNADSHLGHVFTDGPQPTGLRYCMNSASMRFVPVNQLVAQGYGEYLPLFK
ncbi:peptide-methionine (R)-S-oxide reductase MsrB [Pelagibaculum spongiae]|uniref:peptide-methionine (R)-S-oxide reductase n=1 Tax=Pelagibaculum spongiae TaxID=2080658 RepID=A0A2V1GTV1_9GAMM|nr:peptide-methionine (R)-S-oxide reductase MsrB [Pelagibaculum spongiae]PVZ67786.1 peptide-methionine (R)-S-oxide reductase [Pelagibaculum spongiae]